MSTLEVNVCIQSVQPCTCCSVAHTAGPVPVAVQPTQQASISGAQRELKVYKFKFDLQPGSLTDQVAGEHQP